MNKFNIITNETISSIRREVITLHKQTRTRHFCNRTRKVHGGATGINGERIIKKESLKYLVFTVEQ